MELVYHIFSIWILDLGSHSHVRRIVVGEETKVIYFGQIHGPMSLVLVGSLSESGSC